MHFNSSFKGIRHSAFPLKEMFKYRKKLKAIMQASLNMKSTPLLKNNSICPVSMEKYEPESVNWCIEIPNHKFVVKIQKISIWMQLVIL